MNKVCVRLAALIMFAFLIGCDSHTRAPVNDASRTTIVGQYEDCNLYRTTTTEGPNVTWIRCEQKPKVSEVNYSESCGKGCTRQVKTITVEEEK